jgi:protein-histidine pros-kinase
MRLALKFNLALLLVFAIGFAAAGIVSHSMLAANARAEVLESARMIMASALASRSYTQTQVAPLLKKLETDDFIPQTVPAFGATEQFNMLHTQFPDYAYKEATLNPTNLRDKASEWEADVVNRFRQYPDEKELIVERETPTGRSLALARPIRIGDPGCLTCHSTVDEAPAALLKRYGPANGFGWQLHDVIGAQIVSVPMALPVHRADSAFWAFMSSMAGIFLIVFAALNLLLMIIVVRRVTRLARVADEVSLGKMDAPDFPAGGKDEVSRLAQSFNRMKTSLAHAIKLLEE